MGPLTSAAITVGASVASSVFGGGDADGGTPDRPRGTTTEEARSSTEMMFDDVYRDAMGTLVTKMNEWGDLDRNFFENVYRPFQEDLIASNQQLIPLIAQNSSIALEQSMKDLLSTDDLKRAFESTITDMGDNITATAEQFRQELSNLPTEAERIGQAVSTVEQQFGQAGADIRKRLAAQGYAPSQSTERSLAIEKAKAKAGAVGAAGEAARAERRGALAEGAGVFANLQASQSGQLAAQQQMAQTGVGLTSNLQQPNQVSDLSQAAQTGADITAGAGLQQTGVSEVQQSVNATSKGINEHGRSVSGYFSPDGGLVTGQGGTVSKAVADVYNKLSPEDQKAFRDFDLSNTEVNMGEALKKANPDLYKRIDEAGGNKIGIGETGGVQQAATPQGAVGYADYIRRDPEGGNGSYSGQGGVNTGTGGGDYGGISRGTGGTIGGM